MRTTTIPPEMPRDATRKAIFLGLGLALIPGAAQACEGDYNGAGRDVVINATPLSWSMWLKEGLDSAFGWFERSVYGSDYEQSMEDYRKQYWK